MRFRSRIAASLAALLLSSAPLAAQPTVSVGQVTTQQLCNTYVFCWGPWVLVECQRNFAQMRERLESALSESGRIALANGRTDYVVDAVVTELGLRTTNAAEASYSLSRTMAVATLDLRVRERGGGTMFAATVTGVADVSFGLDAGGGSFSDQNSSRAVYAELQRATALAAARAIAFRLEPLRVAAVSGRDVRLNYGAPLLAVDDSIQVADARGFPVQYRVTAVMPEGAIARASIDAEVDDGATATLIERSVEPAGMNRFPRVELPE